MVDKICDFLTNKIREENPEIDDERAEIINYGIHLIVGEIPKFFIIMGIAYLLGVLDLTLLAYFLILPFRGTSGGFHLKTHIGCIVGSVVFFSGIGLLAKYATLIGITKYISILAVWIFGMIMTKIYAPADTENVPIISTKERKQKRLLSYLTLSISLIIAIFIPNNIISSVIIYGMLAQSISITRFAYKLTKNKYGYEVYSASVNLS